MSEQLERNSRLLNTIKSHFSFLVEHYQFLESLETESDEDPRGPEYYFLKYTNQELERQLEILFSPNSNYNLLTLKKMVNQTIPDYYDLQNTIDVKDLDLIHSPEKFNYQRHITYSEESRIAYFVGIANSFQTDWLAFVTGERWFDRREVDEQYRIKKFSGVSGFRKDQTISKIKDSIEFLKDNQYDLILNSNDEAPFKYTSHGKIVLHHKEKDIYLKFNLSYKNKILSFEKKNAKHQSYRLLEFIPFDLKNESINVEELIKKWVISEKEKGGI